MESINILWQRLGVAGTLLLVLPAGNVSAQQSSSLTPSLTPASISQINPVLPIPSQQQPTLPSLPELSVPSPQLIVPPIDQLPDPEEITGTPTIVVRQFRFVGNTVFSTDQLSALLDSYLNRPLEFSELLQARVLITQQYVQAGYVTSGAFLSIEQNQRLNPTSATVTIQVLEGTVESIQVVGSERLQQYVRQRLQFITQSVLNRRRLEASLRQLQIDPLVRSISADLSSGSQRNLSVLTVQVEAAPVFTATVDLNNQRSPTVGTFERGIQLSAANLLQQGELITVGYRNTTGSNGVNAAVTIPFNATNGTASFRFSQLASRIVEDPFDLLEIESDSQVYDVGVRQPIIRRPTERGYEEFALGINAVHIDSDTTLLGLPFPLAPGANANGRTSLTVLRFSQDYFNQTRQSVVVARSQMSFGLNALDATISNSAPDGQFVAWRGQAAWIQRFRSAQFLLRTDVQLADRPLVSIEQFSLGGSSSVLGYRQDALIGDNGLFLGAEIQLPIVQTEQSRLDLVPFFAIGTVWNAGDDRLIQDNTLASLGLGLQYQLFSTERSNLFARLNYAVPLIHSNQSSGSLQEEGLDLALRYQFKF